MPTEQSQDEIRVGYIDAMGKDLGPVFFVLYRELVELHIVWQQYRELFGTNPERVHLLNRTAGLFFKITQDELWNSVLLGISRFTDPPKSSGRANLTIWSLPPLIDEPNLQANLDVLCKETVARAEFAREHRNKRIAHRDHGYAFEPSVNPLSGISREYVEHALASLRAVMNLLDGHFRDSTVMYERFVSTSGASLLIHKLQKLERLAATASAL